MHHEHIDMDGRRQFGLGRRGQLEPSRHSRRDSDVTIATGAAVASASVGTVNSITDTYGLSFELAGTNAVTTFRDNTGSLNVDDNAGRGRNDAQNRRDADQQPPSRTPMARLFSVLVKPVLSSGLAFSLATGGAPAALAASERVVYAFESKQPDGANPWGALINVQGSLYGTTYFAGEGGPIGKCASTYGCGTVFVLSPPAVAGGAWTESMLYVFKGGDDGKLPLGALTMVGGVLYGATLQGGARDFGTVFALAPPTRAGGSWTKSLVLLFQRRQRWRQTARKSDQCWRDTLWHDP